MTADARDLSAIEFTTSIRLPEGRLLVHVCNDALVKLGSERPGDGLTILSRNMPRVIDAARQLAARDACHEVIISAKDL